MHKSTTTISIELLALSLLLLSSSPVVHTSPPYDSSFDPHSSHPQFDPSAHQAPRFHARNYISSTQLAPSYDYIITGGGLAGLVLASLLSANATTTVLVLEAGPTGDDVSSQIDVPATTYYNSLLNNPTYDWEYTTVPQPNAAGRVMSQPRGKVLGGSSAVNGMYIVRPSEGEINAWRDLSGDTTTTNSPWAWDNFFSSLKGTENFSPPTPAALATTNIQYTASSHGTSGKLHTTFPGYMVPMTTNWLPTLSAVGVPPTPDAYAGTNTGGFFALSAENPSNWTRSYSKSAYIDPLPPRPNLSILPSATVLRLTFSPTANTNTSSSTDKQANGVQFTVGGPNGAVQSVGVNKEVVVSGGAMGSPHLLMVSGVGPKDVLDAAGVQVQVELPGVGQHMMDHLAAGVFWATGEQTQGDIHNSGSDLSKTPEFNSFINSGIAYINGSRLFDSSDNFATFLSEIASTLPSVLSSTPSSSSASTGSGGLVPSQYEEVLAGYEAIYNTTSAVIMQGGAGLVEILLSINAPGQVGIQAALQQPMSQGRVYINSSSIWDKPVIDPQYFSHPADIVILRQGIKLARLIGQTPPLSSILTNELTPGSSVPSSSSSDADIEAWLRTSAATEYHPAGTCAMMPMDKGGVVGADMRVYGLGNVRVVDSSVFPVSFSAHVMAPTYALAEKAAEIIIAAQNPSSSSSSSSSGSSSSSSGSSSSPSTTSGALPQLSLGYLTTTAVVGLLAAAAAAASTGILYVL